LTPWRVWWTKALACRGGKGDNHNHKGGKTAKISACEPNAERRAGPGQSLEEKYHYVRLECCRRMPVILILMP